ncbi:MAG: TPM domain-containing protein, partial [Myxococcota bacterium]|nr:TPM domain-containing protein [Myxococcota bacterium]
MRGAAWSIAIAIAIAAPAALASAQPAIERPVTDEAGVLSGEAVAAIESRLHAHRDAGHAQIAVLIVRTTHRVPITDYAMRAAEAWGGGSSARDDGVLFVLAVADRDMRIEVGYGLEEAIPDSAAMRILDALAPPMRAGRFDAAAWMVSDALIARTGGASAPLPEGIAQRTSALPPDTAVDSPPDQEVEPRSTSASDTSALERAARVREARESRFMLGALVFFVVPVLLVFLFLWRSSNVEYDADGAQRTPWRRLPADVLGTIVSIAGGIAASGGGGHGGGGSRSHG